MSRRTSTSEPKQDLPAGREGEAFWDANPCGGDWSAYRAWMDWLRRTEPYAFDILDRYSWSGLRVLEVGCGQGALLNHIRRSGTYSCVGLDRSAASLRRTVAGARELGTPGATQVVHGDAEHLPFGDGTFDAVISFGVLHHTRDTLGAVREIARVLRPGGFALVMLYRTGNPKWWATRTLRFCAPILARLASPGRTAQAFATHSPAGTAWAELFAVPILKAFSTRQARAMFTDFADVEIECFQPGFRRLADVVPVLRPVLPALSWIDRRTVAFWGFYQVIRAVR